MTLFIVARREIGASALAGFVREAGGVWHGCFGSIDTGGTPIEIDGGGGVNDLEDVEWRDFVRRLGGEVKGVAAVHFSADGMARAWDVARSIAARFEGIIDDSGA